MSTTKVTYSMIDGAPVNVKDFGADPTGATNSVTAINNAIIAVSSSGGGTVYLPQGIYIVSSRIILKRGVSLIGDGMADYSLYPTMKGTTIRPAIGFSDSYVILADSATDSTTLLSGVGISDLSIDCINIPALANRIIGLNSVTNAGIFKNISVLNLDDGFALSLSKSAYSGALPTDGLIIEGFFTYGKTANYSSTRPKLEVFGSNEITFIGCKFQGLSNAVAGTIAAVVYDLTNSITFQDCAFGGCETGVQIYDNSGTGSGPRWIRVINCTFETYRYGVWVSASSSNPIYYPARCYFSSNRFISAVGANCRNYYLDKSIGTYVVADDYVEAGSSGTSYVAELTTNAQDATIWAANNVVSNSSTSSIVVGRNGNAFQVSSLYRQSTVAPTLATGWSNASPSNRTSAGYWKDLQGVVHLQGYVGYSSGGSSLIFTLPTGYVPLKAQVLTVTTNSGVGSILVNQYGSGNDGQITQLTGGTTWVSLDGISFALN